MTLVQLRRLAPVLAASLLAAPLAAQTAPAGIDPAWPLAGTARVTEGAHAMVVSGSPIASEVGRAVLQRGGNAVDAAVAVGFALAVVHPEAGNIGGGGFMVIRTLDGQVRALDYRETAPARGTRDMYVDHRGEPTELSITGALASGVPGAVAGLLEAHRRYGRLPLRAVIEPAVRLARLGFVVDSARSHSIDSDRERLYLFSASRAQFLPAGRAPAIGTRLRQPDLARTLGLIRDRGAAGFYRGRTAGLIVAEMARSGGLISRADLAGYRARWREPISIRYRGYTIYSMPPASSGGVTMAEILNIMEGFGPLPPFGSPALLHRESEAMRRAFMDRNVYLGDPAFVQMPIARLVSKEHAESLRRQIDPLHATATPKFETATREGGSTTHYSVVDALGNAVSCTTTLNNSYGSAVTVAGAGFLLNDEMDDFATAPGKPNMYGLVQGEANAVQPGKRMLSAMTPSVVLDPEGRLFMVVGTPGGPRIITMVYHVISNVIDHRMRLADAVTAPRLHHQALPDTLRVERGGFLPAVLDSLRALGHTVVPWGRQGDIAAIIRTATGWQGVTDPRRGGGGAGY
ncbi:MAG TPA: gamma-glutamyltransferase [Gemmatimonadales bacterium]|jgi:gamma-glutamyltranspeptidase/glutathione hydrolase|nr:gamma-glutamyltransferase [Gemmatimonadales bacterium]